MCSECGFFNCPGGCPGASAPSGVYTCDECGGPITLSDRTCYQYGDIYFHCRCLDGISRERLLNEFDIDRDALMQVTGIREIVVSHT